MVLILSTEKLNIAIVCARGRARVDVLMFCVQGHFGPQRL